MAAGELLAADAGPGLPAPDGTEHDAVAGPVARRSRVDADRAHPAVGAVSSQPSVVSLAGTVRRMAGRGRPRARRYAVER